jgi:hypothetical protein
MALDHGSHGPVEDQEALLQQGGEFGGAVWLHGNTLKKRSKTKNPFSIFGERVSESRSDHARFSQICNAPAS